jgi:ABC-type thiamine transport system substrate-binding protein
MSPDNKISLTISSESGDVEDEFTVNKKIKALKKEVMGKLNIDSSGADEYRLVYDDNLLDENKTLEDLEIPDEAQLFLESDPEVI